MSVKNISSTTGSFELLRKEFPDLSLSDIDRISAISKQNISKKESESNGSISLAVLLKTGTKAIHKKAETHPFQIKYQRSGVESSTHIHKAKDTS